MPPDLDNLDPTQMSLNHAPAVLLSAIISGTISDPELPKVNIVWMFLQI
jgi:hypothetical protein